MKTDQAFNNYLELMPQIEKIETIETEAETRFKIIDRIITDVLLWDRGGIRLEQNIQSGYADYLLQNYGKNKLVIEAKRRVSQLANTRSNHKSAYKVSGPVLKGCEDGLKQAQRFFI